MSEEMTREEAIKTLTNIRNSFDSMKENTSRFVNAYNMAIATLEAEPCKDTISRQAALDAICEQECNRPKKHCTLHGGCCRTIKVLIDLPSVNTEPRTGHWIIISPTDMYCSECNEIEHLDTSRKFCAYCGTKMSENPTGLESEW